MDQNKVDLIAEKVIRKIIHNGQTAGNMDLSSAFDCAGFDYDPEKDPVDMSGFNSFKEWLADNNEFDFDQMSAAKAAATAFQFIKQGNKEFGDYWDGNINMPR